LPVLGGAGIADARRHGARTVAEPAGAPDVVLAAAGSEVALALAAAGLLAKRGVSARVLSVLWRERFEQARHAGTYRMPDVPAVWIEAGVPTGWRALAGPRDAVVGIDRFGESGKGPDVAAHVGLTADAAVRATLQALGHRTE
ncbi:MAG: transketolase, partial [Pseudonocardia sp.]|nr:transketolase [Pseudonocardia sp.]